MFHLVMLEYLDNEEDKERKYEIIRGSLLVKGRFRIVSLLFSECIVDVNVRFLAFSLLIGLLK
jgi:hypothetical protein